MRPDIVDAGPNALDGAYVSMARPAVANALSLHAFFVVEGEGGVVIWTHCSDRGSGDAKAVCSDENLNAAEPEGGQTCFGANAVLVRAAKKEVVYEEEVSGGLLGLGALAEVAPALPQEGNGEEVDA